MDQTNIAKTILYATLVCLILHKITAQQCESDASIFSTMLRRHIYKTLNNSSALQCIQACNEDVRCQSFNHVILKDICELNDRTKEARPEDFIPDPHRYYSRRKKKLVPLGSILEVPAETCQEIKASQEEHATSGKYWFDSLIPGDVVQAHCDMETEDLDECSTTKPFCGANATGCKNTVGSFICSCEVGFSGRYCNDVDECEGSVKPCDANANCQNTRGSYVCSCKAGFTGSGKACSDVNECSVGSAVCDLNASCQNTFGCYLCSCKSGFFGNGKTCTDFNECDSSFVPCDPLASCQNTAGSFECLCQSGYTGDGRTCTDADECSFSVSPCDANAICENTVGSFNCSCKTGYNGDGLTCTDIDECAEGSHKCLPDLASCINTYGSYSCSCNAGYTGDGETSCEIALPEECENYQSLNTSDRKTSNTRGCYTCDSSLTGWYRFKDAAGTRMPTTCQPTNRCDACSTGWLNGVHPTTADGRVTREVCFNWNSNCCNWNINIEVRNCGSYFVYKLPPTPVCTLRYCSTD